MDIFRNNHQLFESYCFLKTLAKTLENSFKIISSAISFPILSLVKTMCLFGFVNIKILAEEIAMIQILKNVNINQTIFK